MSMAIKYRAQQVRAYFDRPKVASVDLGPLDLMPSQRVIDLRAPKRSHALEDIATSTCECTQRT